MAGLPLRGAENVKSKKAESRSRYRKVGRVVLGIFIMLMAYFNLLTFIIEKIFYYPWLM